MKKIVLLFLFLLLFLFGYTQQNFIIEIHVDGNSIMPSDTILKSDIQWSMKLLPDGEVINHSHAYTLWNSRTAFLLIIDLSDFTSYVTGNQVEINFEVTNPAHKYYEYVGQRTFPITQTIEPEAFYGAKGINLKRRPAIAVHDTTLCASPGQIIPAMVRYAPDGYQVLWPDSRLTGLPGDKALVGTSFSADSTYQLSAILTDKNGLPLDTAFFDLAFDTLPGVEIVEDDFCLAQGDALFVNGIIPANSAHQWVSTEPQMLSRMPGGVPTQYSTVMPDHNVKVTLTATSTLTGCRNSDSVFIYLRPDKPVISIDTNTTRNNLKISWNADEKASGYTLWSNKWDAYGIEKPYSQKAAFSKGITSYTINTAELDTLEFFYLTAGSNLVCPAVSDTVGYYNFDVRVNTDGTIGSNNLMVAYFDFVNMGISTAEKLFYRIGGREKLSYIRYFDYNTQFWNSAYDIGGMFIDDFSIGLGMILQLEATGATKFLQYGHLPPRFNIKLNNTNTTKSNENYVFFLPQKSNLKTSADVLKDNMDLWYLYEWKFATQQWRMSFLLPNGNPVGNFNVRPLMPLKVELKTGVTKTDWK